MSLRAVNFILLVIVFVTLSFQLNAGSCDYYNPNATRLVDYYSMSENQLNILFRGMASLPKE